MTVSHILSTCFHTKEMFMFLIRFALFIIQCYKMIKYTGWITSADSQSITALSRLSKFQRHTPRPKSLSFTFFLNTQRWEVRGKNQGWGSSWLMERLRGDSIRGERKEGRRWRDKGKEECGWKGGTVQLVKEVVMFSEGYTWCGE